MNTTAVLAAIALVLLFVKREHATFKKEEDPKKEETKKEVAIPDKSPK